MESIRFLLKVKYQRRIEMELNNFLYILILYVSAGYELSYAWTETVFLIRARISKRLMELLCIGYEESFDVRLQKLSESCPVTDSRVWFSVIRELYISGGPVLDAIKAFSHQLRSKLKNDIESHVRTIFTKTNVLMLLFFLPPTLILLFVPFIMNFYF